MIYQTPKPRTSIADPSLVRPDWVHSPTRGPGPLWLDKNENSDPELLRVTRKILEGMDPLYLYTYPESPSLYKKLGNFLDLPPEHLALAAGSDGVIRYAFEAYVGVGDTVIHTLPTFAMYPVYSAMYGAKTFALEYERTESSPALPVSKLADAIRAHRPKLICLPNPDSPTGHVYNLEEMKMLITTAAETHSIILVDEAYHPFYEPSVARWTLEFPNLIVARTFAKAWGLAGLRIGYAIACPELSLYLHKVQPMYETSTFAMGFVEKMLNESEAVMASVRRLNEGKHYFLDEMRNLGFSVLRTEGNFLHVNFGDHRDRVCKALEGVVLFRPNFRENCLAGFSRFSSTTKEKFQPIVCRIADAIHR